MRQHDWGLLRGGCHNDCHCDCSCSHMFTKKKKSVANCGLGANKAGTTRMQNHPSNNSAQNFQVPVPVFENLRLIPSPPLPSSPFTHVFRVGCNCRGVVLLGATAYGARLRRRVATSGSRSCCSAKTDYAAFVSTTGDAFCFSQYTFQECDFDSPHTPSFSPHLRLTSHTHSHIHSTFCRHKKK